MHTSPQALQRAEMRIPTTEKEKRTHVEERKKKEDLRSLA